jgi:hypothetical protein
MTAPHRPLSPPRPPALLTLALLAAGLRLWVARGGALHRAIDGEALRALCGGGLGGPARRLFDGHESAALQAMLGCAPDPGPAAWPGQLGLWGGLGAALRALGLPLGDWAFAALGISVLGGVVGVVALTVAAAQRFGARAGLGAGLLLALLPEHLAWSTSAYSVNWPVALILVGAALPGRPGLRALLGVAAAAMRPELGLAALIFGAAGLPAAALGAGLLLRWAPDWGGAPGLALSANLLTLPALVPGALGLGLLGAADPAGRRILGLAIVGFVLPCVFFDMGGRHLLLPMAALCALAARGPRWRAGLAALLLLPGVFALHGAWQRDPAAPEAGALPAAPPAACVEISDEPPIPGQPRPSWALAWAGGCAALQAPCLVWGAGPEHGRWQSRGLGDRAARMGALWALRPVAQRSGGPGPWRRWFELRPRAGQAWPAMPGCDQRD